MAKVLVVGGAGYVGSATVAWLMDHGHDVAVMDDLSTGLRELVLTPKFFYARAGDPLLGMAALKSERFDCVMHFAARSLVAESFNRRDEYFENNVEQTRVLLNGLKEAGIRNFIFSSTCAVFGNPGDQAIHEQLPKAPINPYGETKLAVERLLEERAGSDGLRSISLRYFNAAGAESQLRVGELHFPETHLIPLVLKAAQDGSPIRVFGNNYATPDGTCIRDYVHVSDLARAHESALKRLLKLPLEESCAESYNIGSEHGYSVNEIIQAAQKVTGKVLNVEIAPPRAGDPPRLVADSSQARAVLGYFCDQSSLEQILSSAWQWTQKAEKSHKAVFLDRDGTLNHDPGYLRHPDQLALIPGVGEALVELKNAGYKLIIVSNQSGVGRGLIEPQNIPRIHARLADLLADFGVAFDHIELCFHRPEEDCECRKPKPKLLLDAAQKLRIDLSQSFMVGDKASDVGAGLASGCRGAALVRTGDGLQNEFKITPGPKVFVGDHLRDVVAWVLGSKTARS